MCHIHRPVTQHKKATKSLLFQFLILLHGIHFIIFSLLMNSDDPYSPPLVNLELNCGERETAPILVVEHLKHTRPWVKFCSIIGFTTSFSLVLIGSLMGFVVSESLNYPINYLLGLFYFILAVLFMIPSIKLSHYEKSITKLAITHDLEDLELAIAHQRAFWKHVAIMIFIITAIYLVTITFSTIALVKY